MYEPSNERQRAVMVAVQLPGVSDEEQASSLEELERLAKTLGLDVIARVVQKRDALAPAAVIGDGKLKELVATTEGDDGAEVVVVDHEISPSQSRNLEKATGAEVFDRTAVIVEIFHRHARTREARLQVELARLAYVSPRVRESPNKKDRQRGGSKGAGESALELDRRRIRDRMAEIRRELTAIERDSSTRRRHRADAPTVALVGYTNAGKSSWMRALTHDDVYIADKLFATLDTTVRALAPATRPRILVSDTVGFIKKLPHDLVASFRSTLEAAADAHLLLLIVDASDAAFREQAAVSRTVLSEIGVTERPTIVVLNKIDRVAEEARALLRAEFPDAMLVSSRDASSIAAVHARIVEFFDRTMIERVAFVPYSAQRTIALAHELGHVTSEEHEEDGTRIRVKLTAEGAARLDEALGKAGVQGAGDAARRDS